MSAATRIEFEPSHEADELCQRIWNKRSSQSEEITEAFGIKLTRKDLTTLADVNWLNDQVINFYLQLICQRSRQCEDLPKVFAFNTFFYLKVSTKSYDSVKNWTRNVDIFAHDLLLVPIHLTSHWCLATVDLAKKRIDYYDSFLRANEMCFDYLKNYLVEEYEDKKKQTFGFKGWKFISRTDIPQQTNSYDCGVFVCKFAEFASRRAPMEFTQQHMRNYRKLMVYEMVEKKLL